MVEYSTTINVTDKLSTESTVNSSEYVGQTTYTDLAVQANWDQTTVSELDYIRNKPFQTVDTIDTLEVTNRTLKINEKITSQISYNTGKIEELAKAIEWENF